MSVMLGVTQISGPLMVVEAGSRVEGRAGPSRDTKRHGSGFTKIVYIQRHVSHGFHATPSNLDEVLNSVHSLYKATTICQLENFEVYIGLRGHLTALRWQQQT